MVQGATKVQQSCCSIQATRERCQANYVKAALVTTLVVGILTALIGALAIMVLNPQLGPSLSFARGLGSIGFYGAIGLASGGGALALGGIIGLIIKSRSSKPSNPSNNTSKKHPSQDIGNPAPPKYAIKDFEPIAIPNELLASAKDFIKKTLKKSQFVIFKQQPSNSSSEIALYSMFYHYNNVVTEFTIRGDGLPNDLKTTRLGFTQKEEMRLVFENNTFSFAEEKPV